MRPTQTSAPASAVNGVDGESLANSSATSTSRSCSWAHTSGSDSPEANGLHAAADTASKSVSQEDLGIRRTSASFGRHLARSAFW